MAIGCRSTDVAEAATETKWAFCNAQTGQCFNKTTGQWETPPNISGVDFQGIDRDPRKSDIAVAQAELMRRLDVNTLTERQVQQATAIADRAKEISARSMGKIRFEDALNQVLDQEYSIDGPWFGSGGTVEKKPRTDVRTQKPLRARGASGDYICSTDGGNTWGAC